MLSTWMNIFMVGGGGGIGAPTLIQTPAASTAIGVVLTVSSGATLYRDGITKTTPYTTTADDALATFWAQVGSTRSASIVIASTATGAPAPDVITNDFSTATAGQTLVDLGWTFTSVNGGYLASASTYSVHSDGFLYLDNVGRTSSSLFTRSGTTNNIEVDLTYHAPGTVDNQTSQRQLYLSMSADNSKYFRVKFTGANGNIELNYNDGSGDTNIYYHNGGTFSTDDILSAYINRDTNVFYIKVNGVISPPSSGGTADGGWDISSYAVPATAKVGLIEFGLTDWSVTPPYPVANKIEIKSYSTATLSISGTFSYASANITLAIAQAVGTTKVRVLDYDDTSYPIELADWATKSNGGTVSATIQTDVRLLVQDSVATSAVVASTTTVPVIEQAAPHNTIGINFNIVAPYYGGDEPRNLVDRGSIFWATGANDRTTTAPAVLNAAGLPVGPAPSGTTALCFHLYEDDANYGRHGAHTFQILNGSASALSMEVTDGSITLGTVTSTTLGYTVPSSGHIDAYFYVVNPVFPPEGLQVLATKNSDGLSYPGAAFSPQASRDYEATQFGPRGVVLRDLHISGVEDGANNPHSEFGYKSRPEYAARASNQTGAHWWHSSHWGESDATRLDYIQRWAAASSTSKTLYFEYLNETWNNGYSPQQNQVMCLGATAGFMPGYTPAPGEVVVDGSGWTDPMTGILNVNVPAGTIFKANTFDGTNGYRWTLTKCLTGAVIGNTVPYAGTNSQWQTIISNDPGPFFTAMYRFQASTQKKIGIAGRAELGSRFKSVIGATSNIFLESHAALTDALMLDNNYMYIDYYALDGYTDYGFNYNTTTYPWMADPTDLTTFKDGMFAALNTLLTAKIAQLLAHVDNQNASFIAAGMKTKYAPRPTLYEFGHPVVFNIPSDQRANFDLAIEAVVADSRMRTLVSGWWAALFPKFHIMVWHNSVQNIKASDTIQFYGLLTRQEELGASTHADYPAYAQAWLGTVDAAPTV